MNHRFRSGVPGRRVVHVRPEPVSVVVIWVATCSTIFHVAEVEDEVSELWKRVQAATTARGSLSEVIGIVFPSCVRRVEGDVIGTCFSGCQVV